MKKKEGIKGKWEIVKGGCTFEFFFFLNVNNLEGFLGSSQSNGLLWWRSLRAVFRSKQTLILGKSWFVVGVCIYIYIWYILRIWLILFRNPHEPVSTARLLWDFWTTGENNTRKRRASRDSQLPPLSDTICRRPTTVAGTTFSSDQSSILGRRCKVVELYRACREMHHLTMLSVRDAPCLAAIIIDWWSLSLGIGRFRVFSQKNSGNCAKLKW